MPIHSTRVGEILSIDLDSLDSLESSKSVEIFTFQRGYAYLLLMNFRRTSLRENHWNSRFSTKTNGAMVLAPVAPIHHRRIGLP